MPQQVNTRPAGRARPSLNFHASVTRRQQDRPKIRAVKTPPASPAIVLDRVTKRFGDKCALGRVSAEIAPGDFVAIIGRSGAGKTTLLRSLCGTMAPSEGRICVGGQDLAALGARGLRAHRAGVGMIYQQFNLVKRLRVMDNVLAGRLGRVQGWRYWAALARRFAAADRATALRCLHHVGMLTRVWQRADTLSGGEQQRVAIAKALAQEPRLILGDEPVASLDVANGAMVMDTLREIGARAGLTVIATLHHVEYARRYAGRVLGLREGRLVFDGLPDALTAAALGDIFGDVPEATAEPAAAGGAPRRWLESIAS